MQPIARCNLRGLHSQAVGEAMQLLCQLWALPNQLFEVVRAAPECRAFPLGDYSGGAAPVSDHQWKANETFLANEADLDRLPVRLDRQDRHQSRIYEVAGFDRFSGFIEDGVKF